METLTRCVEQSIRWLMDSQIEGILEFREEQPTEEEQGRIIECFDGWQSDLDHLMADNTLGDDESHITWSENLWLLLDQDDSFENEREFLFTNRKDFESWIMCDDIDNEREFFVSLYVAFMSKNFQKIVDMYKKEKAEIVLKYALGDFMIKQ